MPKGKKEFYQYAGWIASSSYSGQFTTEVVPLRTDEMSFTGGLTSDCPDDLDMVVFTGGADISTEWYIKDGTAVIPQRDLSEAHYFKHYRGKKPILGICRGMQLINCLMGGDLIQDLKESAGYFPHKDGEHKIFFTDGRVEKTNSFHHQSIGKLAPGLEVVAKAGDGVIEMAKGDGIYLVQFHPERGSMAWEPFSAEIFKNIL